MSDSSETETTISAERIDSRQYIRVLLDQMANKCHLVNITSQLDQTAAVSTLMRVDGKNREILFDKPYVTDPTVEFELSPADSFTISGGSYGSSISFQSEFIEIVEELGLALYRFTFPKELLYSTQRASHRVNMRDFDTSISFSTSSGYSFDAPLCDISDGGIRVRAGKSVIKGLTKGDKIFCKLGIDDSCDKLRVTLCKPSKTEDSNTIEFGATFMGLSHHQKSQISHYIAGLERKSLRKHHSIPEPITLSGLSETVAESDDLQA